MTQQNLLRPEFVELAPAELQEGVIYISMVYGSAVHTCCCGCGHKVVTPFGPKDWKLMFDGDSVSLYPSIGNWNASCRSHYWITNNHVKWVPAWTESKDKKRASKANRRGELARPLSRAPAFRALRMDRAGAAAGAAWDEARGLLPERSTWARP